MHAHVVTISYLERILIFMAELDDFFPSFNDFLPEEELGVADHLLE